MQTHPSANSPSANTTPPSMTMSRAKAIAGSAIRIRDPSSERSLRRRAGRARGARGRGSRARLLRTRLAISGRSSPAKASSSPGELGQRLLERLAGEVRPQLVAEYELRVSRLPQQVVGQPLLAAL